jgi:hypothetical protein
MPASVRTNRRSSTRAGTRHGSQWFEEWQTRCVPSEEQEAEALGSQAASAEPNSEIVNLRLEMSGAPSRMSLSRELEILLVGVVGIVVQ